MLKEAISIPKGSIKRGGNDGTERQEHQFQFQKVRLKGNTPQAPPFALPSISIPKGSIKRIALLYT